MDHLHINSVCRRNKQSPTQYNRNMGTKPILVHNPLADLPNSAAMRTLIKVESPIYIYCETVNSAPIGLADIHYLCLLSVVRHGPYRPATIMELHHASTFITNHQQRCLMEYRNILIISTNQNASISESTRCNRFCIDQSPYASSSIIHNLCATCTYATYNKNGSHHISLSFSGCKPYANTSPVRPLAALRPSSR